MFMVHFHFSSEPAKLKNPIGVRNPSMAFTR